MSCLPCFGTNKNIPYDFEAVTDYKCRVTKLYMHHPVQVNCPENHRFDKHAIKVLGKKNECPVCHHAYTKVAKLETLKLQVKSFLKDHPSENDLSLYKQRANSVQIVDKTQVSTIRNYGE